MILIGGLHGHAKVVVQRLDLPAAMLEVFLVAPACHLTTPALSVVVMAPHAFCYSSTMVLEHVSMHRA